MPILNFLLLFILTVLLFSFFTSFKKWLKNRNYQYVVKGNIEEIKNENNKIYFIIKWFTPNELRENNPKDYNNSGVQYYHHLSQILDEKIENNQKDLLINRLDKKYINTPFYLHILAKNNVIRDVIPFSKGGFNILILMFFIILVGIILIYKLPILKLLHLVP